MAKSTDNPRISRSGVTTTGRIPLYANSKEAKDADPSIVRFVAGNSLTSLYLASFNVSASEITELDGDLDTEDGDNGVKSEGSDEFSFEFKGSRVPSLSDIAIVSNDVVYDSAGIPSVTLVFKIKNSSGETLKGMNAKVELI
jgi:hypothetical protein